MKFLVDNNLNPQLANGRFPAPAPGKVIINDG